MKINRKPELKIVDRSLLTSLCKKWEKEKLEIVFTNGCFDIIHFGHVQSLLQASELGDILFVGLNSDESVRRLKGDNRPVQDENSRALILAAFEFVDYVCIFQEDTPYELIKSVQPDILVKGGEYKPHEIVGYDIVTAKNGKVVTVDMIKGYSSTGIINRILR